VNRRTPGEKPFTSVHNSDPCTTASEPYAWIRSYARIIDVFGVVGGSFGDATAPVRLNESSLVSAAFRFRIVVRQIGACMRLCHNPPNTIDEIRTSNVARTC
jgi:hypothetical protein